MVDADERLRAVGWSTASSIVVGSLGLVGLVIAARALGASSYPVFAVTWGVFFGVGGAFSGLQQEVTRSTPPDSPVDRTGRRVLVATLVALSVALVGALASYVSLHPDAVRSLVVGCGLMGLGLMTYVCGVLAALGRWRALALLLVADALARTAALAVVLPWGGADAVPAAVVSGSLLWTVLLVLPRYRDALTRPGSGSLGGFAVRAVTATLSAGCAALVVVGLPVLVATLQPGVLGAEAGAVLAATSLIRSAFLLMLYGYRSVLLRHFLGTSEPGAMLRRTWGACLAVGTAYVVVVAGVAPVALTAVLGAAFEVGAWTTTALAVGTVGLGLLVISGLALVAQDRHVWSGAGWLVALLATLWCAAAAPSPASAVVLAASAAPWCGVAVHAVSFGVLRHRERPRLR